MTDLLLAQFTDYAVTKLEHSCSQIERCVKLLSVEQVWHRPNEVSNAIGNLVLHLRGNVRQWILTSLGDEPDDRDRPAEFAERGPLPTGEILERLQETVRRACGVIRGVDRDRLTAEYVIQRYTVSGTAAVFHAVEHFSLHTGQIVYATKLLINQHVPVYDAQGQRLDGRQSGVP